MSDSTEALKKIQANFPRQLYLDSLEEATDPSTDTPFLQQAMWVAGDTKEPMSWPDSAVTGEGQAKFRADITGALRGAGPTTDFNDRL